MGVAIDAGVRATHQQQKCAVYRDGAQKRGTEAVRGFTAVGPERWDQGADEPRGAGAPSRICQTEAAQCAG